MQYFYKSVYWTFMFRPVQMHTYYSITDQVKFAFQSTEKDLNIQKGLV